MYHDSALPKPEGKLGVLVGGLNGSVATTLIAGTFAVRKGLARPIGSLTQSARLSSEPAHPNNRPLIREVVPLADLNDVIFGGWDIRNETAYAAARNARVLEEKDLSAVKDELETLRPMKGVFERNFVPRLSGVWVKSGLTKFDLVEQLRDDIREFRRAQGVSRLVMIWCGSTEIHMPPRTVHRDLDAFVSGLKRNDPGISPSMLYAFAALSEDVPHVNCTPNVMTDCPALNELAGMRRVPLAGKDLKTGQTLVKTVLAPMLKARMLGISGWFSTNLLGNRDGEVLDDPECFRAKEQSKLSSLEKILEPELYPQLYGDVCHKVTIHYYPPRGDNKEGWDNVDLFGWMGYAMQLKINFLCRDSILAAPVVLDLALFMDLAARAGAAGVQDWLSFFFKCPLHGPNDPPEHNLFAQLAKLEAELRRLAAGKRSVIESTADLIGR
jgi:myo-inositol-1-phosphate synthase